LTTDENSTPVGAEVPEARIVPQRTGDIDPSSVQLSPEEAFLLFKVDGVSSMQLLIQTSGFALDRGRALFESLRDKGLVGWDSGKRRTMEELKPSCAAAPEPQSAAGSVPEAAPDKEPWLCMAFDEALLEEKVDLDEKTRRKILYLHQKMGELTHYQVLEVERRADARTIKRAYFDISRQYHPDTYFRKELGSYKSKVEDIFKRITQAYDALSNEESRRAYDQTLPYEPTPEELEAARRLKAIQERDERLREERRQRLLRRMPLSQRKSQAREHFAAAKDYLSRNDPVRANNELQIALSLNPGEEEYRKLAEEIRPKSGKLRAERELKRARSEESMGRTEEALRTYLRVIEFSPDEPQALAKAAELLLQLKRDLRQAVGYCRRAQALEPDNAELMRILAEIYLELGMNKNALREYARYAEHKPTDEAVQARLKELRRTRG
jgi:curved DNA-binding protein CbpA